MMSLETVLTCAHLITAGEIKDAQLADRTDITHMPTYGLFGYAWITFDAEMHHQSAPTFNRMDIL